MYKISELIGKQSITLTTADSCGVVAGAYFDKTLTRVKCFMLLSDDDENRFYVEYKAISSALGDAVVIRSAADITDTLSCQLVNSPINCPSYNQDGKSLGIIRDIIIEADKVISFVTDCGEIPAGTLLSRSDSIAVFNDTGKPVKIKHTKAQKTEKAEKKLAPVLSDAADSDIVADGTAKKVETPIRVTPSFSPEPVPSPATALSKYYFLLGKRLQRSIYADSGAVIARENDLVTEDIIQNARKSGKLVAVALHSL